MDALIANYKTQLANLESKLKKEYEMKKLERRGISPEPEETEETE